MKKLSILLILTLLLVSCSGMPAQPEWVDTAAGSSSAPIADTTAVTASPSDSENTDTDADTTADVTDTEPSTDTDAPVSPKTVSFFCAGDNLVHEEVYRNAAGYAEDGGSYDFLPIYEDILPLLSGSDIAFLNQESQICGESSGIKVSGWPNFCSPPEVYDTLSALGFNVFGMANNHMLDKGADGYIAASDYARGRGLFTVGDCMSESEFDEIRIFECGGVKIAFLAYTDVMNNGKNTNGYDCVVPYLTKDALRRQIPKAVDAADIVIVSVHWGKEHDNSVTSSQRDYAQLMTQLGANIIIGHHPHVIQPIEYITSDNGNKSLCMFSLGDFLSSMCHTYNLVGLTVSFKVSFTSDGSISFEEVKATPIVTHYTYSPDNPADEFRENIKIYLLDSYTEQLAAQHGANRDDNEEITLARLRKYVTDNISGEFYSQD